MTTVSTGGPAPHTPGTPPVRPHDTPRSALLSPESQPLIATLLAGCLIGVAAWFMSVGGHTGGLVHHDTPPPAGFRFTVDINEADEPELAQLPGVGPTTARRIVDRRREAGPFATIDALLDVPGIGPVTLDSIRPHLRPIP